ncbi:hypothetical protein ONS96_009305 [Cadophora gregata f. sp. sojae]|nr:hypothetical protein ONS96_009305 [Cadophora gregata f. sp. sojae]
MSHFTPLLTFSLHLIYYGPTKATTIPTRASEPRSKTLSDRRDNPPLSSALSRSQVTNIYNPPTDPLLSSIPSLRPTLPETPHSNGPLQIPELLRTNKHLHLPLRPSTPPTSKRNIRNLSSTHHSAALCHYPPLPSHD